MQYLILHLLFFGCALLCLYNLMRKNYEAARGWACASFLTIALIRRS